MYIAMPLQDKSLSNHFTKASAFALFNQNGDFIKQFENPGLQKDCEGKSKLVELLNLYQVSQVVVKNVGERMLGKLLDSKIVVKQVNQRGLDVVSIFEHMEALPTLASADQGRESINYREKQKTGGCCNHEHKHAHKHEHKHIHGRTHGGCCSDDERQQHGQKQGKGRCCQR
ncbi:NifB/NifX family molybdenum-iron cluster-binding protein [Vibrio sp. WJH972]